MLIGRSHRYFYRASMIGRGSGMDRLASSEHNATPANISGCVRLE